MVRIFYLPLLVFLFGIQPLYSQQKVITLDYSEKNLPFGLSYKIPVQEPEITVILSGGGARGLSQIGFLKALTENDIPIANIIGTSIGSIIGGLYSVGYSVEQLDSIVRYIPWEEFLSIKAENSRRDLFVDQKITEDKAIFALRLEGLKPVLPTALNTGQILSNYLNLLVLNAPIHTHGNFEKLKTRFNAVCTDLISGQVIVLNKGSLSQAMRASASVSLFLTPVKMDTLLLVDGGLVANIPVKVARDRGSEFIIAFNTTSPLYSEEELANPFNIADQLVSIPMRLLSTQQLEYADMVIEPELGSKKNNDFSNVDSLIEKGYNATIAQIDKIKAKVNELFLQKIKKKEFFIKNIIYDYNALERVRPLLHKYSKMDSVSNHQIMKDLYDLYRTGDFDTLYANVFEESNRTVLQVFYDENPTVSRVEFSGVSKLDSSEVDSIFSLLTGKPYNVLKAFEQGCEILNKYRATGYSLADIEMVKFDSASGLITYRFDEGIISEIIIEGNEKTNSSIIAREIPMVKGGFFNYKDAQECFVNLRSTNLFRDFNLTDIKDSNKHILFLRVLEKPSSLLRFGLRIDNEYQTQLSVDLRDENIIGSGTELGLVLSGGIRNRSYLLEHKANRIFKTYLTYKIRTFYEYNDIYTYKDDSVSTKNRFSRSYSGEYRQISQGFSIGLGTQVGRFGNFIIEGKYLFDELKNKRDYYGDLYKKNINLISLSSTIDSQDKYPYPQKGFHIKTSYETAQEILGGDVGYTKFTLDYKSYFTIGKIHTFSPKFVLGFADNTLPLSQHYSLGGLNSFFGLRENEFRGRQIFTSSLQYRLQLPVKLFFDTYIRFRYDIGSTWATRDHIKFKDLRHGAGAILSFDTPIGPADFAVGRSFLFTKDTGTDKVVMGPVFFYFTVGYYY